MQGLVKSVLERESYVINPTCILPRAIASLLDGVKAIDATAFLIAPIVSAAFLTTLARLAVGLPAARASRTQPMQALRAE